ncbi:acyl-CoA dehydrogenase family protein [Streptomyces sp. NPDC059262]|uniref:acyl-CoA dehydrogenase family protein n=1 Tax=Streptomyces sp. NPDC059262 TaxID=3346797 RepID=UPI0036A7B53F
MTGHKGESSGPAAELRAVLGEMAPALHAAWPDDDSFPARVAWQKALAERGWAAPHWPVADGGRGLGAADRLACQTELAAAGAPDIAGIFGIKNVGPALSAFGTPEQRGHLERILTTDEIWVQGFSEPGSGSDLASLRTRAVADGDEFVVNGQKVWTSDGMLATHCMLLVRTDPNAPRHQGISVLLVPLDTPGIERRPLRQMTGEEGFAELFFTDVRVPRSALLGPLNEGWRVTMTTLGHERVGVIEMAVALERDVREAVEGFDDGIADPVLRQELARRYVESRTVGLLGASILRELESGHPPGPAESVIKLGWSLTTQRLSESLLTAAGPTALAGGANGDGAEVHRFLRGRASTIAAGTTEVMKNILAERVLGLPRS